MATNGKLWSVPSGQNGHEAKTDTFDEHSVMVGAICAKGPTSENLQKAVQRNKKSYMINR